MRKFYRESVVIFNAEPQRINRKTNYVFKILLSKERDKCL